MYLNVNKSPGPDNIHPNLLKQTSDQIAYPLKIIFHKSLEYGQLPQAWKQAEIRPIFKSGDRSNPSNYRPISLTSIVCKVMEKFIKNALNIHLINNNLLLTDL